MKAFHFSLEAVRTVREHHEQAAIETYGHALAAREQAAQRLRAITEQLNDVGQEIRDLLTRGCPASEAAQAEACHHGLQQRHAECVAALNLAECQVNTTLKALIAARREREIVDKYHDKQKSRHSREQLKDEQKVLDDIAGRRPTSMLSWNPTGETA